MPTRDIFLRPALEVAPTLLGARLRVDSADGAVAIRITELEAYHGAGTAGPHDAGSHARMGRTARNASMFGPPGHAYVYFTYGMHYAINLVCSPEGTASGLLVRAGEVVEGFELARARHDEKYQNRRRPLADRALARGPGNVATALGVVREEHDGSDLFAPPFSLTLPPAEERVFSVATGPRVGVAGEAGGPLFPWRFWISGDPTVSAFRPGRGAPRAR